MNFLTAGVSFFQFLNTNQQITWNLKNCSGLVKWMKCLT